ncbi:MAG: RNA polymerase subunit sigma-24 [Phycisphaerae bacterium]|nr:MAG: RNA polymerase subunit sigma-24 [Phycisphaerae bacterium]
MILEAGKGGDELADLLQMYWAPIYAFLRRRGNQPDVACDLTQDFIAEVVLQRDLVNRARKDRGRFRTFLLTALSNYVIDHSRSRQAKSIRRTRLIPPDEMEHVLGEQFNEQDPADAFDRRWATSIMENTIRQLEDDCMKTGLEKHWKAYELWVLKPAMGNDRPETLNDVANAVGVATAKEVSILLHAVKRRFVRTLRQVVGQTLADPKEIDAEIMSIKRILLGD